MRKILCKTKTLGHLAILLSMGMVSGAFAADYVYSSQLPPPNDGSIQSAPVMTPKGVCGETPMCFGTLVSADGVSGSAGCLAIKDAKGEWTCPSGDVCANDEDVQLSSRVLPVDGEVGGDGDGQHGGGGGGR